MCAPIAQPAPDGSGDKLAHGESGNNKGGQHGGRAKILRNEHKGRYDQAEAHARQNDNEKQDCHKTSLAMQKQR